MENIEVYDEEVIPEEKVILNEQQQEDDLMNELMKKIPEEKRTDKRVLRQTHKLFKHLVQLKKDFSIKNSEGEIVSIKEKGEFNKPHLESILHQKSKKYTPVVGSRKKFFKLEEAASVLEPDDDSIYLTTNNEEFLKLLDIQQRYKQGEQRINYSYRNELAEIKNVMRTNIPVEDGIKLAATSDQEVFTDCFTEACKNHFSDSVKISKFLVEKPTEFFDGETMFVRGLMQNGTSEDIEENEVKADYSIGDRLIACSNNNNKIAGTVVRVEEDAYIIDPEEGAVLREFEREESGHVKIFKDQMLRNPYDPNEKTVLMFENLEGKSYEDLVKAALPTGKVVFSSLNTEKVKSFRELESIVNEKEGISIDDFTEEEIKKFKRELESNADLKQKIAITSSVGKNLKEKRSNFRLINNKILDQLVPFYGQYPLFNSKIDSQLLRIKWIESKPDNGELYYLTLMGKINEKFLEARDSKLSSIEGFLKSAEEKLQVLKQEFSEEMAKLNQDTGCFVLKLAKIYNSEQELEVDNYKEIVDKNGDLISPGQVALVNGNSKSLWKRIKGDFWKKEKDLPFDSVLNDNVGYCNQNGESIEQLDLKSKDRCFFDKQEEMCVPKKIMLKKQKINDLIELIEFNKQSIDLLGDSEFILEMKKEYRDILIKRLNLNNNISKIKENQLIELQKKYLTEKEESEYSDIYYRIDKYLENISNLEIEDYYIALNTLIELYGRTASDISDYNENPRTIYCRLGFNKEICCKHHTVFIEYAKGLKKLDKVLEELNEEYGVEEEGYIVCNNCGQHIQMSNYEVLEGFLSNKSRDITATEAVVDEEQEYESQKGNPMVETLKSAFLQDYEDKGLNVVKIIHTITGVIGLTFTEEDTLKLINSTNNMIKDIKGEKEWKQEALKRKKLKNSILNKLYKKYKNKNLILYTASNLFVYAQSGVPSYSLTKTFTKCVPSLAGFPMEDGFDGIKYISCVLEAFKSSGGDWSSLEKTNVRESMVKIIEKLKLDDYISYRYSRKLKEEESEIRVVEEYKWNEFRPPLHNLDIKVGKTCNNPNLIALKYIENVNKHINKEEALVTQTFIPKPLHGNCCLDTIGEDYNYRNDLMRTKDIRDMFEQMKRCSNPGKYEQAKIIENVPKKKYESFSSQIGSNLLDSNDIKDYFLSFVSEEGPYRGLRRIFDDNVCIYTGLQKSQIMEKEYTLPDYKELKEVVNTKNQLVINKTPNVLINVLDLLTQNNIYLNEYFISWAGKFNPKDKSVWEDLESEIKLEVNDIAEQIGEENKELLLNLGDLKAILEDDINHMGESDSIIKSLISRQKLLKSYIQVYFTQFIFKLKNSYLKETPTFIPQEWKLNPLSDANVIEKYQKLIVKRNNIDFPANGNPIIDKIADIILKFGKDIELILSESQILDCKGSPAKKDIVFNEQKIVTLLHYLVVNMITNILAIEGGGDEDEMFVKDIVNNVLKHIEEDKLYLDKHTLSYIQSVILSKAESDKEDNLNFIKELDKDTWNSLKTMIFLGLDTWKNLSNKNRSLYIPNDEPGEEVPTAEEDLRLEAAAVLGGDMSEHDFEVWKDQREANKEADLEAAAEMDLRVVVGDDDEMGDIEGDNDF